MKSVQFEILLANLRLYSVQAIVFLASVNSFYLLLPEATQNIVPSWIVAVLNMAALAYGYIGRNKPQPAAVAKINSLRSQARIG